MVWAYEKTQGEVLPREVIKMEVPGRKRPGRPEETWIKSVEEDST